MVIVAFITTAVVIEVVIVVVEVLIILYLLQAEFWQLQPTVGPMEEQELVMG